MDKTATENAKTDLQNKTPEPAGTTPGSQPDGQQEKSSPVEHGGRPGLDPTRYGDWEKNGRCIDF